jgi:hypothetical protein
MRTFERDQTQPKHRFGTMEERCTCGAIFSDHYNGRCPCDVCGTIHDVGECPEEKENGK